MNSEYERIHVMHINAGVCVCAEGLPSSLPLQFWWPRPSGDPWKRLTDGGSGSNPIGHGDRRPEAQRRLYLEYERYLCRTFRGKIKGFFDAATVWIFTLKKFCANVEYFPLSLFQRSWWHQRCLPRYCATIWTWTRWRSSQPSPPPSDSR